MEKCCIIYNEPLPGALEDELDVLDQVDHIEQHLLGMGFGVYRKGITANFMAEIDELKQEKPDFVFNLVESINNKGELNYFIPALLNLNSIPYSGNSHEAIFLTTNKIIASKMMKDIHNIFMIDNHIEIISWKIGEINLIYWNNISFFGLVFGQLAIFIFNIPYEKDINI